MIRYILLAFIASTFIPVSAQISFMNSSVMLSNSNVRSGVLMGVADMNGDGLDDLVRMSLASDLLIEFQQADGSPFVPFFYGNTGAGKEWGMAIGDVNNDGYNDVMVGGVYNRLKVYLMDDNSVDSAYWLPLPDIFLQAANFVDIDNDGLVDLFACNDDGVSSAYRNLGNNTWMYDLSLINSESPDSTDDDSGNYGSVWTDYDSDGDIDLYISKCRGGVSDPFDGRRTNLLFENDGAGGFTEVALDVGLRPHAQSWAADFADIDNDGDLDCFIVNHDSVSQLYLNENNLFTNITMGSGMFSLLDDWSTGIQCVFDDFDNDTWVDLIVTGVDGHYVFHNNGDLTFTAVDAFPDGTPGIHSLAVGDLNNDGFLDMLTGYAIGFNSPSNKPDRLFFNDGNSNNWFRVQLRGNQSNRSGIGARLELYGNWGKQIREVRGGEGYGIATSLETHFGLGADSTIDSLVVLWPSGSRDVVCDPEANTVLKLAEGCGPNCEGNVSVEEATICAGESYMFGGEALTASGTYTETGTTMQGCAFTNVLELTVSTINTAVTQDGLTLSAGEGLQYQWIDCGNGSVPVAGATNREFTPDTDGSYAVIVSDEFCSDTSDCFNIVGTAVFENTFPFDVEVYPNPTSGPLTIRLGTVVDRLDISVMTVHGALVRESAFRNTRQASVDLTGLPGGLYILEIGHEGRKGQMQLLLQ